MPVFRSDREATSMASLLRNGGRVLTLLAMLGAGLLPAPGVLAQTPPVPAGYIIHELPTLGGDAGSVVEVNDAGMAVGWSEVRPGDDEAHATLWVGDEAIDLGTVGGDASLAIDINDAGVIVGYAENPAGERHAVIWRDGVIADLGTLGGENSSANAVNESGVVVGKAQTASGDVHAVQWSDGEMRDLGTLGGAASEAMDIADNGVVYGTADTPDGSPQAVMWSGSLASALGTPGGEAAYAMAVNPSGLLVGFASDPDGVQRALVWRDGVRTPHRLDPDDPTASVAVGINDRGDISGSIASATPQMRAVIWRDGERMQLPGFVDDMSGSFSITNAGVVGGYAANASGHHRPVLWVPTSVPTPAALVGASVSLAEVDDDAAVSNQFTVESHDIFFEPAELEVPANTNVTILLPNLGAAPHNFSIDALGVDVDIAPGATEEVVINAPAGEYEFYCNVPGHTEAGMVGTLIVREDVPTVPALVATPTAPAVSPTPAPFPFVWDQVDVTVRLRQDGSFRVTERDRVAFSGGPFRSGYREIPLARIERVDGIWVGEVDGSSVTPYRFVAPEAFSPNVPHTYTWRDDGPNLRIDWSFPETTAAARTFQIGFDAFGALRVYADADSPYQQISWIGVDEILTATAPVNEASLTFILPRAIEPSRTIIQGPGSNRSADHTTDGQTWVWRASDLGPGESLTASLRFSPLVSAEAPSWQEASDRAEVAASGDQVVITPVPSPTPAPAGTPVSLATPVATPVAALPCRDVMESDFPGQRRTLRADCTTDRPLFVPEAWVFDGDGHTIYARDPNGGRLSGGVVTVSGDGSTVRNVTVDGSELTAPCLVDHGATSLAGVLVQGSSGEVTGVTVRNLSRVLPAGSADDMGVMESCGAGITVEGPPAEAFVVENTIENAGLTGILINGGTASISHNTIDRVAETGILATNGANVRVSPGNRVTNGQVGIQLEDSGTGGRIAGNTIESMSRAGIAVILDAHATVADNTVEDAFYGIFASSGAATNMNGNTIRRAQDSGIIVSNTGTRATIENNTIDSSLSDGIWAQEGAQASVLGNTVTGSARYGIAAIGAGTRATIDDNTVADSGLNGVWAGIGSVAEISGNAVNDAAEDGILATGSAEATIAENRVTGGQRGIEIAGAGTTATVVDNTVERVGVVGITINQGATASDVSGNAVSEARFGIVTLGAGTTSTVANNTVSDLSGTGFTVEDGAASELRGNHVSDVRLGAFVTSAGTTADLTENRIERANIGGIIVDDGAQATVAGNTLLQPGTNGIEIEGAGKTHLEGNTIRNARGDGIRLERSRAASATEDSIELVSHDIYYEPNEITIPAETDVTLILPNDGAAPHNVTIDALGVDVDIAPGAAEEIIVNAPAGTYKIYCGVPGHREAGQVAELLVAPSIRSVAAAEPAEADVIRDNEISGGENGIVVTGSGATAEVTANSIVEMSGTGIAVAGGGIATVENTVNEAGLGIDVVDAGSTATLTGNRVTDTEANGIKVQGGAEATLHENVVMRAGTMGIYVGGQGTTATLTGNVVSNAAAEGIKVERAATATITDANHVIGGQWGIAIVSDGTTAEVRGNRASGAVNQGISVVHGASATVADNSVHGSNAGIYVRHPGSRAIITGNFVAAEKQGIYVLEEATAERIEDNTVTGGASGIVVEGEGATGLIVANRVSGVSGEGIAVIAGASATIDGNSVQGGDSGIYVEGEGSKVIITGNTVAADRQGIFVWFGATAERIEDNVVTGGRSGIRIVGSGTKATVTGNEISDVPGIGITFDGAVGAVTGNTLTDVASTGIRVLDATASVNVSGNTLRSAGSIGIEALAGKLTIANNTIEGSQRVGIYANNLAVAQVTANSLVGPDEPDANEPGPYGVQASRAAHGRVTGNRIAGFRNANPEQTGCGIFINAAAPDVVVDGNLFPAPGNEADICDERESGPTATPVPATTPIAAAHCLSPAELDPNVEVVATRTTILQKSPTDARPPRPIIARGTRLLVAPSVTTAESGAEEGECGWIPVVVVETGQPGFIPGEHVQLAAAAP
jgi:probable HAF family extracellular repeat protein